MSRARKPNDPFTELTWADLEGWAGSTIVRRGKRYQRNGCVSELARTDDGGLIAWVDGSRRYPTLVAIRDGELLSIGARLAKPLARRGSHSGLL